MWDVGFEVYGLVKHATVGPNNFSLVGIAMDLRSTKQLPLDSWMNMMWWWPTSIM